MKKLLILSLAASGFAFAGYETWTSEDGRSAQLDLIRVTEVNGEKVGTFRMRNGRTTEIKASNLSPEHAERLKEWKDEAAGADAGNAGKPSVFDDMLDGNLLRLDGKSLKKCADATKPTKYYVFYYTASWCGPCQQFTPSLVEFYNENKNDKWELVLITSDRDEDSMENYAVQKKMPWPQLKLKKADDFKEEFEHGVTGIPSVMVCELDGTLLGNYRNLAELKKLVD